MFSVLLTPWHNEGTILAQAPTLDEAMALAHLDYNVVTRPMYVRGPDGSWQEVQGGKQVVREDSDAELGVVGSDYSPVQNAAAFRVLLPLLDRGVAKLETGGVLRGGADAWLMVRWDLSALGPMIQEQFAASGVQPFGLLSTNHNGRRGVLLSETDVRVVCANTLSLAEAKDARAITVRHVGDATARVEEAAAMMWASMLERYEVLAAHCARLRAQVLTDGEFTARAILPAIGTDPRERPEFVPDARMADAVVQRWERKRDRITYLWDGGKGHTGDRSAWEAYNAVVEAVDHDADLFPTRSGVYRTQALMDGTLRDIKRNVLRSLLTGGVEA